jgi:hypothetical protein
MIQILNLLHLRTRGGKWMSENALIRCPCCGGRVEYIPDQDGSADWYCTHCGWREHRPSGEDIAAAVTLNRVIRPTGKSTMVLFVQSGLVQSIEGDADARVILCDFDCTDGSQTVAARPCSISVWEHPEELGEVFKEVLDLLARDDGNTAQQTE